MDNSVYTIEVKEITKTFTSTKALQSVSLKVKKGEVLGLIGENGSGKSTLSAIISGNLKADSGEMFLFGEKYQPVDSFDASEKGISMIVQEQGTIETLNVASNIFAGREKQFCKFGILNSSKLIQAAGALLNSIGVDYISPSAMVSSLSFEDRKLVEIARAFYKTPELFIVDETTTALPQKGRDILYSLINKLRDSGKSILFISHDIDELIRVCDEVTILRDGKYIATLEKKDMIPSKMKALMVGREVTENYYRSDLTSDTSKNEDILYVKDLSSKQLKNISFTLKKGEILGFAGLSDCGIHDIGKAIFGLNKIEHGIIELKGGIHIKSPGQAIKNKIGFMSKNRDTESMLISMSIKDNIVIASLDQLEKMGFFITPKSEKELAEKWCANLNVKMRDVNQSCADLSGGNKQKIVLAKWLGNDSNIFILDCPTRGIDVGVKEAIYKIMGDLRQQGKSIIMISEELPEVVGMSDRVLVMKGGEIKKEFVRDENLNESNIIQYMI